MGLVLAGVLGLMAGAGFAVLFGRAVAGDGVAAQAQGHREGDVVVKRLADGGEGGEAEADGLRDGDEVGVVAGAVVVNGVQRGDVTRSQVVIRSNKTVLRTHETCAGAGHCLRKS
jgi:nitrous oxidase accessory protein NosD